ncbi:MAG: DUF4352 domain-containing protein [Methanomassiliicoccus sp.]|nr:DUF4352 domain-containing protein [Methanomassiliicoccus sp.]
MALSKKMLLVIAVIAVVAIIAIAAVALSGGNNNASNDNDDEKSAENSTFKIVVTDVADMGAGEANLTEIFFNPSDGNHFVFVNVQITSKISEAGTAPALLWSLYTSDGQIHSITFLAENTVPSGIQGGATVNFVLPFEVVNNTTPTKLVYSGATTLEVDLT